MQPIFGTFGRRSAMPLMASAFLSILITTATFASPLDLPHDSNGETAFSPSKDTHVIYVESAGDDATCLIYSVDNVPSAQIFNPRQKVRACATFSKAFHLTRKNAPDWILFKKGDIFTIPEGIRVKNGRSAHEPFLVGAYGQWKKKRPKIVTGDNAGLCLAGGQRWAAVYCLEFYANHRDPDNVNYQKKAAAAACIRLVPGRKHNKKTTGILLEHCKFSFYANRYLQHPAGMALSDTTIRLCHFADNHDETIPLQTFYKSKIPGIVLEKNAFSRNKYLQVYRGDPDGDYVEEFDHEIDISQNTDDESDMRIDEEGRKWYRLKPVNPTLKTKVRLMIDD